MSLQFSYLSIYDGSKFCMGTYESGHPDEYDARELIADNEQLSEIVEALNGEATIVVEHYDFDTRIAKDDLAEASHFAMIHAYNEMIRGTDRCEFIYRDDVERGDRLVFPWKEEEDV